MKKLLLILSAALFASMSYAQHYALFGEITQGGTTRNSGTIYMYDLVTGKDSVIFNFDSATNGYQPLGNMVQNPNDSLLYGLTTYGGTYNSGVLFSINPYTGKDSTRVVFNGTTMGYEPWQGNLTWYNNLYYGLIWNGGANNKGVIFSFDPKTNKDSVLYNFNSAPDASQPWGTYLTPYSDGKMYSMTFNGGTGDSGAIFRFDPTTNTDSVMVNLGLNTGYNPEEGMMIERPSDGLLYGVNGFGGTADSGTFFSFNPKTGAYTVLVNFNTTNGSYPFGSIFYDQVNDMFYGMTYYGGANNLGVIYSYNPITTAYNVEYSFDGTHGANPDGNLIQGQQANTLYGFTQFGGHSDSGVVFSFDKVSKQYIVLDSLNARTGGRPGGSPTLVNICRPTSITTQPTASTVCAGTNATFTGAATNALPGLRYQWWRNSGSGWAQLSNTAPYSGAYTATLQITGVTYSMNGNKYYLEVDGGCSPANTDTVTLAVDSAMIKANGQGWLAIGSTDTITATGGVSYTWSTGGTNDTIIVAPLIKTTYTVTGTDAKGCTDTASFTVNVTPLGIANIATANSASLYPNPANETLYLSFSMKGSATAALVTVTDVTGKEVMNQNMTIANGQTSALNVSTLAPGMYFVKIASSKYSQVIRFVKQ